MNRAVMACLSIVILAFSTLSLGAVLSQYITIFGPKIYTAGIFQGRAQTATFKGPSNVNTFNGLLNVKVGSGEDIVFENCSSKEYKGKQLQCLFRNLTRDIELALFRPALLTIEINGVKVLSERGPVKQG